MRCPKCGYNSFDYLSECGKCHTDLIKTRQELGFSSVRPNMPAWLESLVKEGSQSAKVEAVGRAAATDLDDLLQAAGTVPVDEPRTLTLDNDSMTVETSGGPIEFRLDDDDLSLPARVGGRSERGPVSIDSPASEIAAPIEAKTGPVPPASSEMIIDLSDDLHDWSLLDLQMDEGGEPAAMELQDAGDAAGLGPTETPTVKPGQAAQDETIIELSEEDLEGLLLELENGGNKDDKA